MKNNNTKEKRMQTLPLLYYINKTPFYKLFSIKNLYQIAVCVLGWQPLWDLNPGNPLQRCITVLETGAFDRYAKGQHKRKSGCRLNGTHKS